MNGDGVITKVKLLFKAQQPKLPSVQKNAEPCFNFQPLDGGFSQKYCVQLGELNEALESVTCDVIKIRLKRRNAMRSKIN